MPQMSQKSVLVVEDEPGLRRVAARALTRAGFRCDLAGDGGEALERLAAHPCDVVVTDLKMPGVDGHALCVDLLAREDRPAVLVLTGVAESHVEADLRARGVDELLFKPVSYRELADVVAALAERGGGRADDPPAGARRSDVAGDESRGVGLRAERIVARLNARTGAVRHTLAAGPDATAADR